MRHRLWADVNDPGAVLALYCMIEGSWMHQKDSARELSNHIQSTVNHLLRA